MHPESKDAFQLSLFLFYLIPLYFSPVVPFFFFFYFLLLFYSPTFVLCLGKHRDAATGIKIVLGKI